MPKFAANLTFMFGEVAFLDRFAAAASAGFRGIEYMFPYAYDKQVLRDSLDRHGLVQVLINLPAGNWEAGERGIACHPDRVDEFEAGVERAIEYAKALDCPGVNCLAGLVPPGVALADARETFVRNVRFAADQMGKAGVALLIEAINTRDIPGFLLTGTAQALEIRAAVGSDNVFLQHDVYHMQIMEGDLTSTIERSLGAIRHIQIADVPGRHEPGTGEINFTYLFDAIDLLGYTGWIGCEYKPLGRTVDGLGWLTPYLDVEATS